MKKFPFSFSKYSEYLVCDSASFCCWILVLAERFSAARFCSSNLKKKKK
ncbi:hypothetical protein AYI68_g3253, partial [Smittium mucronatum]